MSNEVTIINYQMGNLYSVKNAFEYIGYKTILTDNYEIISKSKNLVLPGVGSFKKAMEVIISKKIDLAINQSLRNGAKILGICLGMQLLGYSSTEEVFTKGLALIDNEVEKFNNDEVKNLKIPHVGFNSVTFENDCKLFRNIKQSSDFYFVHSYRLENKTKYSNKAYSYFNYGKKFIASF